ncbi:MAG TPA: YdcF family protein [Stellaceae bacterium]|nr:YdcF family protein [Stellaceae bacterium]
MTPPAIFIWLVLIGSWLSLSRAPLGMTVVVVGALCLYALSMPLVGRFLLERIEAKIPVNVDLSKAQAIVVLGAGTRRGHGEAKDSLNPLSWERVAMAADAYRKLHLPVAAAGGQVHGEREPEAWLMKAALDTEFQVPVAWLEDQSRTTYENAVNTERLMKAANIDTVVVVTHSWHQPRALWAFEHVGLKALPWPAAPRDTAQIERLDDLLPSIDGLVDSYIAFHEMLGSAYYRMRF